MLKSTLVLSAAAAALALPAVALAQGHGGGHAGGGAAAHMNTHASTAMGGAHAHTAMRTHVRHASTADHRIAGRTTRASTGNRYNGYACAPGLAGRVPACVPPGQLQRGYRVDQRLPDNYRYYVGRSDIPDAYFGRLPDQYESEAYRYIYSPDRSIYVVDPATSIIRYVLNL